MASGSATITTSGSNLLVTQSSQNAIVSWQSFSVGGNASAHFENGTGATLNRVTGNLPSSIDGSLTATGSLYLINPAGIAVGTGGMVRTGGSFIASTHDAADADFLDGGALTLKGNSKASVINRGFVSSLSGDVVLTARRVENSGTIEAPNGSVGLLGGYEVELRDTSLADGKFAVKVGGPDTEVVNSGTVRAAEIEMRANGGTVQALAGNTKAIVKATGVKKVGGRIFLTAGDGGTVKATQKMVARRAAAPEQRQQVAALPDTGPLPTARPDFTGGEVHVAGGNVTLGGAIDVAGSGGDGGAIIATAAGGNLSLLSTAALDASGHNGGLVLLGGDYQGGGDAASRYWAGPVGSAATTDIAEGAAIAANGAGGAGGHVVVWSDLRTAFGGTISATGVTQGGDAEVSGKATLAYTGFADLSAASGAFGNLLLDPYNVIISNGTDTLGSGPVFTANANDSVISATTLMTQLAGASVTVSTGAGGAQAGDITVAAPVTWSSATTLTLDAWHSVAINAPMTIAGAGGLALKTNDGGTGGTLSFAGGVQYTGSGGSLSINSQNYELLYSMADLQGINTDVRLSGRYALAKSLDASAIPANGVGEWIPLGTNGAGIVQNGGSGFTGNFTGLGNTVSNLTIDIGNSPYAGLFGYSNGNISDIGMVGGSVAGGGIVGGLIGRQAGGSLTQAYATGAVSGAGYAGGLVGYQTGGSITDSYATGKVDGGTSIYVGGLVGYQTGSITRAYATGAVSGASYVGGLVGWQNGGSLTQAYATGKVDGTGNMVGGLVGLQSLGVISQSYATGKVDGTGSYVGGLVGYQTGSITQAYATGAVTGSAKVGGLVGYQLSNITQAYATGAVTGSTDVGGLVGDQLSGSITAGYFDSYSTGQLIGVGVGAQTGVTAVTSDPGQSGAANYAYKHSAYTGNIDPNNDLTFTATPGGSGWFMIEGQTRPFGAWEYSTNIANGHQLQLFNMDFAASYTLARDIDLAGEFGRAGVTSPSAAQSAGMWNGGFVPLGTGGSFTGNFSGLGHTISNLIVDIGTATYAGLFAYSSGNISDLGLLGGSVKGGSRVGGLVGTQNGGSIARVFNTGTVTGSGHYIGGLVGVQAAGSIEESYVTGAVNGVAVVGGLVGWQDGGSIAQAYAAGAVSGTDLYVGGLVGYQTGGNINQAYATGVVTGTTNVGGLVGRQYGSIAQSYATGAVSGAGHVGGLVGYQTGSIMQAYATGAVSGANFVGGLVGTQSGGSLTQAYATGKVDGSGTMVGGLVGILSSGGVISQSYATGKVDGGTGNYVGGLVGFQNSSSVTKAYATGTVNGGDSIGGLVGAQVDSVISESYATGAVNGGGTYVGGLVGQQVGGGSITDSYAIGSVTGAGDDVGGLVGYADGGTITRTYATGTVDGRASVGGLVGNADGGTVLLSYATGAVSASGNYAGGLVGYQKDTTVADSYASGPAAGVYYVGGLAGELDGGSISMSYATGAVSGQMYLGGLFGWVNGAGTVTASYFDTETTGQAGVGLTTAALQAALPTGFDSSAWGILPGISYPYLKWRFPTGPSVVSGKAVDIAGGNDRLGVGLGIDGNLAAYGHTGANGIYNFMVDPAAAGSSALVWLTGERFTGGTTASRANAVGEMPASGLAGFPQGMASGLDLYADTVNIKTALPKYSDIAAMMARALYGDGTGVPLTLQLPDVYVLRYDGSCGCDVSFFPGDLNSPQASVRIDASAPLLTWDGVFDSLYPPLNTTILAAGDVLVTTGNGIEAGDINGIGGGSLTMTVGGNLTLGQDSAVVSGTGPLTLTVNGDLSLGADAALVALGGDLNATVGGNVTLGGAPNNALQVLAFNSVRLNAGGDFTMAPEARVVAAGTGDAIQIAIGGKFDNQTGADALFVVPGNNARWLVYLASPVGGHDFGSLDSGNTAVWNTGAFAPVAAAGNRYVFAYQPTLTFTSADATKTYGEIGTLTYTVGGLMPGVAGAYLGDTATTAYSGAPLLSSAGSVASATVAGGPYAITIADNGLSSAAGYAFAFVNAGRLTVTPRPITVRADDQRRLQGQPDPALSWTVAGGSLASFDTLGGVFSGSLARASGEVPGTYAIGQGTFAADANYALTFLPGSFIIGPVQSTDAETLERQQDNQAPLLLSASSQDGACVKGVLGPDCAAYLDPANRNLGPNIDVAH